jgi:hypothetical protein
MSVDGSITLHDWGEGEHVFRLAIGEMRQLQEVINRPRAAMGLPELGPRTLFKRLLEGEAWPQEVREVLRLGLIGAGMKAYEAQVLVKQHAEEPGQLVLATQCAAAVLGAAMHGVPDDPVGKKAEPVPPKTETMTGFASPSSTGSALQ